MYREEKISELLETNSYFYELDQHSNEDRLLQATKDFDLISEYMDSFNLRVGSRVGDFIKIDQSTYTRITHHWGEALQTGSTVDSYHLGRGCVSYSGGLDPSVPTSFFETHPKETTKQGRIWIFSNGWSGGDRGVFLTVPFRVFRIKTDDQTINEISKIISNDLLHADHPLHLCDPESSQYKSSLTEYYFYRNSFKYDHPLIKGCVIQQ